MSYPPYGPPGPPYRQPPPYQPPPPRPRKAVTKTRGLSGGSHTFHLLATVFTCGLWLPIWGCVWLYRMLVRRKSVTRYR